MLEVSLRNNIFWLIDFLRGQQVKSHYSDIKERMSSGEVNALQLEKLLVHASKNVPFYKAVNTTTIQNIPVVNKLNYKECFDDFLAKNYENEKRHKMSTSGSTGVPFTFIQDINKRKRVLAEIIYFNEICGHYLGEKYAYFRVWTDKNKKSRLERFKQNLVPVDILHLDDGNLSDIRNLLLKDKKISNLIGYASTFEHLIRYLENFDDRQENYSIRSIVSGSEVLDMDVKKRLKKVIGSVVIDRYSSQENGIVAQTPDMSDEFIVNISSYNVELLKLEADVPSEVGELSRIIVTDLYNFAMPMIRYDTGDLAIRIDRDPDWSTKLKTIQGRQVDTFYDTSGRRMTAHTWSVYMWKFDKLKQYQFIQDDEKKYTLNVCCEKNTYSEDSLRNYLKKILGSDAEITIKYVNSIPVLSSGKFKKTICNYNPN